MGDPDPGSRRAAATYTGHIYHVSYLQSLLADWGVEDD